MIGHSEARHNDFVYHAAIHGVKMKPYVNKDDIIEKANRLDEIREEETKQGKSLEEILVSIKDKTYRKKKKTTRKPKK